MTTHSEQLAAHPSAWQSTKQGLPELGEHVLIYEVSPATNEGRMHLAWRVNRFEEDASFRWQTNHWGGNSHCVVSEFVTHWMLLPAPPQHGFVIPLLQLAPAQGAKP